MMQDTMMGGGMMWGMGLLLLVLLVLLLGIAALVKYLFSTNPARERDYVMNSILIGVVAGIGAIAMTQAACIGGDAARGQRLFGACAAYHSLQPNQNLTGPNLADLWNRKAGSLPSFSRYSDARRS
jgi:cytochrome c